MQFRELRSVLQKIVVAGLPAVTGCGVLDVVGSVDTEEECTRTVKKLFTVNAATADPPLELRIESCRVDADACVELCSTLMARAELPYPEVCGVQFLATGQVNVVTQYTMETGSCHSAEGRRPAGLVEPRGFPARDAIGRWLAEAAWLEAASIPAFIYLARELDMHGAPRGLARAALAAARDEIRHARIMKQLARRYGATPPPVDVAMPTERSLEAMAIENAAEGCVRETWGAVVAMWQAQRATDPMFRAAFRHIAEDEARHAALAWQVDQWVRTRLSADAHARIDAARVAAVEELFADAESEVFALLGLPMGQDARGLLARTTDSLWMRGAA